MKGSGLPTACLMMFFLACHSNLANAFGFEDVARKANELAGKSYQEPQPAPDFLQTLEYSVYQGIRFKPEASLWRSGGSPFQIMMIPQGSFYAHAVKLHVIDSEGVKPVTYDKADFDYPTPELAKRVPADLGYAGFKLTFPFDRKNVQNQFLVFGGGSYFRAIGKGQQFGLSGRGISIDT